MTDLDRWKASIDRLTRASSVWLVQLGERWYTDPQWARVRDDVDLALFKRLLHGGPALVRRILLYDPPSDVGGALPDYRRAKAEHERWISRVRRQLCAVDAPSSAALSSARGQDVRARLVILPRTGQQSTVNAQDGIWLDGPPPDHVLAAWQTPGLIPLDPHEENIIGPHSDRNPLWAASVT
jgi:hypothetical protein